MRKLDGAFSVVALSEGKADRLSRPARMRPLCLGRLDRDWVVASESARSISSAPSWSGRSARAS